MRTLAEDSEIGRLEQHGAAQLLLGRRTGVAAAPRDDVVHHEVEATALLAQVLHLGCVADDHDGAVIDVGVVGGAGHDEAVDERHGHADLDLRRPRPSEEAAGGRPVQVDDVTVAAVGEGDDDRETAIVVQSDVAHHSFVQDRVDVSRS